MDDITYVYIPGVGVYGHGMLGDVEAAEAVRGARLEGERALRLRVARLEHLAQHAVARHQRAALAAHNTHLHSTHTLL